MRFLYACVLLILTFGAVHAAEHVVDQEEQYQLGLKAYEAEDYDKAYEIWLPIGEAGYAEAAHKLGYMNSKGLGREIDSIEAQKWYLISAKEGKTSSKYNLAYILLSGKLSDTYIKEGNCWLLVSAAEGSDKAKAVIDALIEKGVSLDGIRESLVLEYEGMCGSSPRN